MCGVLGVEVLFFLVGEIVFFLVDGSIYVGIIGEDLMCEVCDDLEFCIVFIKFFGFGGVDVVVVVLELWMDVWIMCDFEEVFYDFCSCYNWFICIVIKYFFMMCCFFLE